MLAAVVDGRRERQRVGGEVMVRRRGRDEVGDEAMGRADVVHVAVRLLAVVVVVLEEASVAVARLALHGLDGQVVPAPMVQQK